MRSIVLAAELVCKANRLEVAQLTDEDDVGVLTQRRAQGFIEAQRIAMDFTLVDQ